MAMVVKNNMSAVNTLNTLNKNTSALQKSLQKVSSGMKINSAQDDASGYAISERMRVMISSLDQANQNTQNGSSLMKVAEGAVSSTVEILKTLKKKAIDAATDTNTDEDRAIIQKEIDQYVDQIDDNALVTFNGKYLLDGSKTPSGKATYGSMTNEALAVGTNALTKLTELYARNGEHLVIESTDQVTVSYVQGGNTYVTTFKVADNNLGAIFRKAEDIDQSSQLFATTKNEDVAQAEGLITAATDKTVVDNAVAYLKDALNVNIKQVPGSVISDTATAGTKFMSFTVDGDTDLPDDLKLLSIDCGNTGDTVTFVSNTTITAGTITGTYDGELFTAVKDALNDYNTLAKKVGYVDLSDADNVTGSGATYNLYQELQTQFTDKASWDGSLQTINVYKDRIYSSGNDTLIGYYEEFVTASAQVSDAKTTLDGAVRTYNEGLAQLDALLKLQDLENAKNAYSLAVESYISNLTGQMTGATAGTFKLDAAASYNNKALTYAADNELTDAEKSAQIKAITDAVAYQLNKILDDNSLNLANLAQTGLLDGNASTLNGGDLKTILDALTYTNADDNTDKDGVKASTWNNSTVPNSLKTLPAFTTLTAVANTVKTKAGDMAVTTAGTNEQYPKYLALAQEDTLANFSGPALLTGSQVGVDATNHIVTTPDGKAGLTITAANSGLDGQIAGFSISISDAEGNVRKSVDTALNSWTVLNFARNESVEDNALKIHIGAAASQSISVGLADMRAHALGLKGNDGKVVDVSTQANANAAVAVFNNALQKALDQQTTIGAIEARLEYTASNLTVSSENVQAAESVIRDADMAKEMTNYTKNNVLLQAAQSMLAQANQNSSAVLSLLQ